MVNIAIPSNPGNMSPTSHCEKLNTSKNLTQPINAAIASNAATLPVSKNNNSLLILPDFPQVPRNANFTTTRTAPEIFPPENSSLEFIEIIRMIQIVFCSADVSQAEVNAQRVQEVLKAQAQKTLDNQTGTEAQQQKMGKWGKVTEIVSKILSGLAVGLAATAILTATGVGVFVFAIIGFALSATTFVLSLLPKDCLGTRKDLFGHTVTIEPSLGGLIDYISDKTVLLTTRVEGVEGGPKDGPFFTKKQYEDYKLGWTITSTILIALPFIIFGGVQVAKAGAQGAEKIIETASKSMIEAFAGGKSATVLALFSGAGQVLTVLTAIGMGIGNAYLAGDRQYLTGLAIQKEKIEEIITHLQARFQTNHEYFQGGLSFQETLRKTVAAAIVNYIEMSAKISKNHA